MNGKINASLKLNKQLVNVHSMMARIKSKCKE